MLFIGSCPLGSAVVVVFCLNSPEGPLEGRTAWYFVSTSLNRPIAQSKQSTNCIEELYTLLEYNWFVDHAKFEINSIVAKKPHIVFRLRGTFLNIPETT